jgi:1-acyl-sn-glycerol-3-phosphate acyltransferase
VGNAWVAWSPCTARCVGAAGPRVTAACAARRSAAFARTVARALRQPSLAEPETLRVHAAAVLDALEVRLDVRGGPLSVPGEPGTLVVANHISWLDVVALLAVEPVTMLAKREVAGWPVAGPLVRRAGTLFIDRSSLRALPGTVARVAELLRGGRSVMVFPQGATWCTAPGGRFHRAVFQAALDAGAPVRPVAVDYVQHGAPTTVPAFVGEDGFAASLLRVARASGLEVRVQVRPPVVPVPGVDDRRAVAARAQLLAGGAQVGAEPALPPKRLGDCWKVSLQTGHPCG